MGNSRQAGIDILKSFAIFSIIAQHFFTLQTPFLHTEYKGLSMLIQGVAMEFFLIGVPLFVAITGYLNANKTISKQYYRNILKVLIPYLLISIIFIFAKKYLFGETITIRNAVGDILRFNAIPYGWYIEMWIGLYLLAPFFNTLFNNIQSKRNAIILLITLALLTILPTATNRFGFHLLPGFWTSLWPLLCYYIGAYIRKYQPTVKSAHLIAFIIICCSIEPLLNIVLFPGHDYVFVIGSSLLLYPVMAAFLILLYKADVKNKPLKAILAKTSDLTLYTYLICALFDMLLYPVFLKHYESQQQFGLYFLIIVPILFALSSLASLIFDCLIKVLRINRIWLKK